MLNTERVCKACGRVHTLQYFLFSNGARHLFYKCPTTKQHFMVPFISGLPIVEVKSKKLQKQEIENRTPKLL